MRTLRNVIITIASVAAIGLVNAFATVVWVGAAVRTPRRRQPLSGWIRCKVWRSAKQKGIQAVRTKARSFFQGNSGYKGQPL